MRASQPKRVYRSSEQAILIALTGLIGTGAIAVETLALSRPWGGHIGYLLFAAALGYFYLFTRQAEPCSPGPGSWMSSEPERPGAQR